MKKLFIITVIALFLSIPCFADIDCDSGDSNDDMDIACGGTNASTAAGARTNLGLVIGTDVQAYDADLDAVAALTTDAYGLALLETTDEATLTALINLEAGTDFYSISATDSAISDAIDIISWSGGDLTGTGKSPQVDETNLNHDSLANWFQEDHVDWATASQGTIDATNLADLSGTYQVVDAMVTDIADLTDPGDDMILGWDDTGGLIQWMIIGSGLSYDEGTDTLTATGTGDVTGVGDCDDGACLDGSSDGGSYVRVYDGDSHYAEFQVPNIAGDITYTFPTTTGTIVDSGDVLILTNTDAFTPTTDYHPSTKKYVDDEVAAAGGGDVTSVADCQVGLCYDGTDDGGTYVRLYDGDSNYTQIAVSDSAATITATLQAITGTLYVSGGTDIPLADGGTGESLADPGADRIGFWDNDPGEFTWLTVGSGLDITATTLTASLAGTVDISDDTNLAVTVNELTLTDDTLGLADHNDARTALGLAIGTDVQAYGADLDSLDTPTAWRMFYSDAADPFIQEITLGANGTFLESNGASAAPDFRALEAGDIPDISATYEGVDAEILRADTADTISAVLEWQDGVNLDFGNGAEMGIRWETDLSDDDTDYFTGFSSNDEGLLFIGTNAAEDLRIVFENDHATFGSTIYADNIVLSGTLTQVGDQESYVSLENTAHDAGTRNTHFDLFVENNLWNVTVGTGVEIPLVNAAQDFTITGEWDFGGADYIELPNDVAAPSLTVKGRMAIDTTSFGDGGDASGPFPTIAFHNGVEKVYVIASADVACDVGEIQKVQADGTYDCAADNDSEGTPVLSSVADPEADWTPDFDDGEETVMAFASTGDGVMFDITATAAFTTGDAVMRVLQETGNPDDGHLLILETADADVTQLSIRTGANDIADITMVDAGTYTNTIVTDGADPAWIFTSDDGDRTAQTDGMFEIVVNSDNSGVTATQDIFNVVNFDTTVFSVAVEGDVTALATISGTDLLASDDIVGQDDLQLDSDGALIELGESQEIFITHVADVGFNVKHSGTTDDLPLQIIMQTGETNMEADDVLAGIYFQAPDEGTGTDAILVAAGIEAVSEGDFSATNNATKLSFLTGASETAAEKMSLSSAGVLTIGAGLTDGTATLDGSGGITGIVNLNSVTATELAELETMGATTISATQWGFLGIFPANPGTDRYLKWDDSETGAELVWAGGGDLLADGTVPLTANWDVGAYTLTGTRFISDIAIGTSPFAVTSTTVVTNLNADTVDGESASAIVTAARVGGASASLDDTDASVEWEDAGSLDADGTITALSVLAGDYAAASIDGDDVNSNIAGRSLTLNAASPDTLDADAELYTDTKCMYFEDPTADDDFQSIWRNSTASDYTITEIWAESDQTVTFMLQVDDGTPADIDSVDLAPAAGEAEDTSLDGDTTLAANEELDLAVTSVASAPTWVSICWTYTKND